MTVYANNWCSFSLSMFYFEIWSFYLGLIQRSFIISYLYQGHNDHWFFKNNWHLVTFCTSYLSADVCLPFVQDFCLLMPAIPQWLDVVEQRSHGALHVLHGSLNGITITLAFQWMDLIKPVQLLGKRSDLWNHETKDNNTFAIIHTPFPLVNRS